jgi:hypothetical protein
VTWFSEKTGLEDFGWHEVEPINGGLRRFERDDGHPYGYVEYTRPISDLAIAYNMGNADATLLEHGHMLERSRREQAHCNEMARIETMYPKRRWFS